MKLLFILKHGVYSYGQQQETGLLNSARLVVEMLNNAGQHARLVIVTDNNDIDREVNNFKPDIAIVEALWVVPEKFDILKKLHPQVRWIVRIHSGLPFLAEEGIAIQWIFGYLKRGIEVAFNSEKTYKEFLALYKDSRILYLPNYYPAIKRPRSDCESREVHIGCFGAIRPMKNQLTQAVAAILYADQSHQILNFYINSSRCERGGDNVLKNLRALFRLTGHRLIEIPWLSHEDFVRFLSRIDAVLCVSMTETFCIAAADAVVAGASLVCSSEIPWADPGSFASITDATDIAKKIKKALSWPGKQSNRCLNFEALRDFSKKSQNIWLAALGKKKSLLRRIWEY